MCVCLCVCVCVCLCVCVKRERERESVLLEVRGKWISDFAAIIHTAAKKICSDVLWRVTRLRKPGKREMYGHKTSTPHRMMPSYAVLDETHVGWLVFLAYYRKTLLYSRLWLREIRMTHFF